MRNLSGTLLAAQRAASRIPYVEVQARNTILGVVRLDWERLYTGSEPDYFHAATMPSDGSLIRVRVTLPGDSKKLYRQRVASPGPGSDFSTWTYCDQYNVVAVCACSLGTEVSLFWIKGDRSIYWMKSTDCGASFGTPELLDYTPTTAIYGVAAAYKGNGDLGLFFADQATLYAVKRVGGTWGTPAAWDKSTGDLSSVAVVYSGDWNLAVTGKASDGNYKVWSLVYGDGGDVAAGTWSALKEMASAPSAGEFQYRGIFLGKPDVYRVFFVEKFTGAESYNRPFWSHSILGTNYLSSLWREPVPFNLSSEYGLALAHQGIYCWLSAPYGVWRAGMGELNLDLTSDVLSVREDLAAGRTGRLVLELRNDDGRYSAPGTGGVALLKCGNQVDLSPGYRTTAGNECSYGQAFTIDGYEHVNAAGRATLVLYALDAWSEVERWLARHQFRWNKTASEMSVKDILAFALARAGLKLQVKSQSATLTGYYPDFTINPGNRGDAVVQRLLSFVPDVLFIEGYKVYVVNPQAGDSSAYSYGTSHAIAEGRYRRSSWQSNCIEVEGRDPSSGSPIIYSALAWDEVSRVYDRITRVRDVNLDSVAKAQVRGDAYLRESEIGSLGGAVRMAVNCGQQMYDVVDVTDGLAGLSGAKRRVVGITVVLDRERGLYEQSLALGAV